MIVRKRLKNIIGGLTGEMKVKTGAFLISITLSVSLNFFFRLIYHSRRRIVEVIDIQNEDHSLVSKFYVSPLNTGENEIEDHAIWKEWHEVRVTGVTVGMWKGSRKRTDNGDITSIEGKGKFPKKFRVEGSPRTRIFRQILTLEWKRRNNWGLEGWGRERLSIWFHINCFISTSKLYMLNYSKLFNYDDLFIVLIVLLHV